MIAILFIFLCLVAAFIILCALKLRGDIHQDRAFERRILESQRLRAEVSKHIKAKQP